MIKFFANLSVYLLRRGHGLFKFLFVADDFIRLFAIAILLPLMLHWLGLGTFSKILGFVVGLVIDMHDFITEFGPGKIISKKDLMVIREKYGLFKFLFVIDDLFRVFIMTILFPVLFTYLGLGNTFVFLGVALGLAIDIHDILDSWGQGKLTFDH